MPRKTKKGDIPRMSTLSPSEQDVLIQRWRLRHDLRRAYPEIIAAMLEWIIDSADIAEFVADGHLGQFSFAPERDFIRRMEANGFNEAEVQAALLTDDIAADWMSPEEQASVLERIAAMKRYFQSHDPGTFAEALKIYELLGQVVRRNFIQQYGYAPEQTPVPRVKITGTDSERKKLKPTDHQPELF